MQEISQNTKHHLLQRFPQIELSYETIPHMKVSSDYNLCVGIPIGTKCYVWITYYGEQDVCFVMELNKERKISIIKYIPIRSGDIYANGTVFYGTVQGEIFIIEDVLHCKGIPMKNLLLSERLGFLECFMKEFSHSHIRFYLPVMWYTPIQPVENNTEYTCEYIIPKELENHYPIHHIQYRCLDKTAPYLNVYPAKKGFHSVNTVAPVMNELLIPYRSAIFTKPQYRQPTIFKVMADMQYDIYRLFVYGSQKTCVYYNVAYISNYKMSVFMNSIFRNIKENANLDAIEESDDEEDFENMDPEKYVDLKKSVFMECKFNTKFKKWMPIRVVDQYAKVVHISQL
jgi:hypothetical protein